ncbi:hypothetical protein U9M48_037283, partial [Paspalum notatum var. saurae]
MSAFLNAFAPYVKKFIADMAQEEVSMLLGVSGEITKLEDNMEGLKAFLADVERRYLTDKTTRACKDGKPTAPERSSQKMTSEFNEPAIVGVGELESFVPIRSINKDRGNLSKKELFFLKSQKKYPITQHFDEAELFRAAMKHARARHGGEEDKALLMRILTDALSSGRFLLILDDVWTLEVWSNMLSVPIKKASQKQPTGNWVLITTRFRDLAQQMGASFYQHHVSLLDQEGAWSCSTNSCHHPIIGSITPTSIPN